MDAQSSRTRTTEGPPIPDGELAKRIPAQLQSRLGKSLTDFRMSVWNGGLILRGQVTSYYCKQLVQEVVMDMSGMAILANDIEVQVSDLSQDLATNKDDFG